MSRLTMKILENGTIYSENGYQCLEKLYKLEDIEEEIGIELITLFKQPYCTIFVWKDYGTWRRIEETTLYSIIPQEKCIIRTFDDTKYYWKDYGKTWALTKEELENE